VVVVDDEFKKTTAAREGPHEKVREERTTPKTTMR